jgi:3-phytase
MHRFLILSACLGLLSCQVETNDAPSQAPDTPPSTALQPTYITPPLPHDSDDPAIWIHPNDPAQSLIVGTDKSGPNGGLYVFDLQGQLVDSVLGLNRPNNVDIEYGMMAGGDTFAIAVTTERLSGQLRAYRLPEMTPVDGGGLPVFADEANRAVMGIALYRRPADGAIFAIVSRKTEEGDPADSAALRQYRLLGQDNGHIRAELVRSFGYFSGQKEIEAIAVDNTQGYVFYSDEQRGVRQYHADPDSPNVQLAHFATEGFAEDHEGISIYPTGERSGYILVSDQGAQRFQIYSRAGNEHALLKIVDVAALESDGSEITPVALNEDFPRGLFVAMSDDRTFHLYDVRDLLGELLP